MRKLVGALIVGLITAQFALAADRMDSKACSAIANACKKAGFTKNDNEKKSFWFDCMKPVLLGNTVKGVTLDAADIKTCREEKIEKMKNELEELKNVSG